MANLIITVIAIALVAIAALMGAYYGGSAFMNNQINADAAILLNMGNQVQAAFRLYAIDHDNGIPTSWADMVQNGYLNRILIFPPVTGNNNGLNSGISMDGSGTYWLWGDIGAVTTQSPDPNAQLCLAILKKAFGSTQTTITTGGVNHSELTGNTAGNGSYGCEINASAQNDPGALNVMADNPGIVPDNHYAFFYRLN